MGVWCRGRGISHGWTEVGGGAEGIITEARQREVKVIISEALVLPLADAEQIARALPNTIIVHLLHGAPAWCASYAPAMTYGAIRQSQELANVFAGTVSDPTQMTWPAGAKVIHLPNPIELPPELVDWKQIPSPRRSAPITISLIARPFPAKNWGGMLAALGILASRRPVRAICAGRPSVWQHHHFDYLAALGIPAECMEFADWSLTLHRVAERVHVGLASGFTDSLNLIAAEHCLLGTPVVGSPSTSWMPRHWQVNPQDPQAMADAVEYLARHRRREGRRGRKIVRTMAKQNEAILLRNLNALIGA